MSDEREGVHVPPPVDVDPELLERLAYRGLVVAPVVDRAGEADAWLAALVIGHAHPALVELPLRLDRSAAIDSAHTVLRAMAGAMRRAYPQCDPDHRPRIFHTVDSARRAETVARLRANVTDAALER